MAKTITQVGTSVDRVIEDKLIPDSVRKGVISAIFRNEGIVGQIMGNMVTSLGVRAEQMYQYGKKSYTHGLPSGTRQTSTEGKIPAKNVLSALHGSTVDVEYSHYGPPNSLHIGWMKMVSVHGFNSVTNQIGNLTTQKGTPVYLKDIVVVVPASRMALYKAGALDQWGVPARHGYAPGRALYVGQHPVLYTHSPVFSDPAATDEYVKVTYVWEVTTTVAGITTKTIHEDFLTMSVSDYDESKDYFHVHYTVGGAAYYWMYLPGSGTHPTLDSVYATQSDETGTYFPFTYFRYNKVSEIADTNSEAYKTSKKMTKILGLDYDQVSEGINSSPNIADVEQAMMIMAVPATTDHELEQKYLFDFFDGLYEEQTAKYSSPAQAAIRAKQNNDGQLEKTTIVIQDKRFKMTLSHSGIYKRRMPGNLGKRGIHTSQYVVGSATQEFKSIDIPGATFDQSIPMKSHYYRRQITETMYEEIRVESLEQMYYIFQDYATTADETDDILLIPLDRAITSRYSIPEREQLFSRSLHYVFNSRVVTKLKWYQTGVFKFIIFIIAIALTILDMGMDGGTWIGIALTVTTVQVIIVNIIINMIIGQLLAIAFNAIVKVFGQEIAYAIAIIAVLYGGYKMLESGKFLIPNADKLLMLVNGLTTAAMQADFKDLLGETQDFQKYVEEQTKTLDNMQDLLDNSVALSPFIFVGETPDSYYARATGFIGNVGTLAIESVNHYVDMALKLPGINDTLGEPLNDATA